ncbi:hypothetical protein [Acidiphilium acidophilum]|uniref:hypothetical protein n=1 Tax=Acidiphilium acidophilum TaxID=76588 RepID=UPI002E8E7209|nr:hypothetical protein [Acidiphilium acidophilum]
MAYNGSGRNERNDDPDGEPNEARGLFLRGARFLTGPGGVFPKREIRKGWKTIGALREEIRVRRAQRRLIRLREDGTFDLEAMAFDAGVKIHEIERRMANRQILTARNTKIYLGLGSGLLAFWAYEVISDGAIMASTIRMAAFLAVILCIYVAAFANAFNNWQIRARRLGTVDEFIRLDGSWWPHER